MNIGQAAKASNLPAKTIRYYEEIELVIPARTDNGYRNYSEHDVHRLRFVQRARSLGFSVDGCRQLLSLYGDKKRASADVKSLVSDKLQEIDRKLEELSTLRDSLKTLHDNCRGDDRPDCPILDDLSGWIGGQEVSGRDK